MERGGGDHHRNNKGMKEDLPGNGNMMMMKKNEAAVVENEECMVREQDRFMPIANVIRIMRKILPPHAKISDDAKETIQECVSEYISFITGEANERCHREQRKTITAEDVLWAMSKLGFDDYIEPLTIYLNRYRDLEGDRAGISAIRPHLPPHPNINAVINGSLQLAPSVPYGPSSSSIRGGGGGGGGGFPSSYQQHHHGGGGGGGFYPAQMGGGGGPSSSSSSQAHVAAAGSIEHPQYAHPNNNNL